MAAAPFNVAASFSWPGVVSMGVKSWERLSSTYLISLIIRESGKGGMRGEFGS